MRVLLAHNCWAWQGGIQGFCGQAPVARRAEGQGPPHPFPGTDSICSPSTPWSGLTSLENKRYFESLFFLFTWEITLVGSVPLGVLKRGMGWSQVMADTAQKALLRQCCWQPGRNEVGKCQMFLTRAKPSWIEGRRQEKCLWRRAAFQLNIFVPGQRQSGNWWQQGGTAWGCEGFTSDVLRSWRWFEVFYSSLLISSTVLTLSWHQGWWGTATSTQTALYLL